MTTETKSRKGIGGPNTPEGKAKVKLNALKMGLYSHSAEGYQRIADAVGVTFDEILQEMRDHYRPADPVEETLVRRVARCSWKLMVIEAIEDRAFADTALRAVPDNTMEGLSVIERRTDVQLHRSISALALKRRRESEIHCPATASETMGAVGEGRLCAGHPEHLSKDAAVSTAGHSAEENVKNKLAEPPIPSVAHAQPGPEFVPSLTTPKTVGCARRQRADGGRRASLFRSSGKPLRRNRTHAKNAQKGRASKRPLCLYKSYSGSPLSLSSKLTVLFSP